MKNVDLDLGLFPDWLKAKMPVPGFVPEITYCNNKYIVQYQDKDVEFSSLHDAYYSIEGSRVHFDWDTIPEVKNGNSVSRMIFGEHTDYGRFAYIEGSLVHDYEIAQIELEEAQERALDYEYLPEDFVTAYNFCVYHPTFWTIDFRHGMFTLNTENTPEISVSATDNGTSRVWFEHGQHYFGEGSENRAEHYHDPSMSVEAVSLEKAYIAFAKVIYEKFFWDGTPRSKKDRNRE